VCSSDLVGVNKASNAGIYAIKILANEFPDLKKKLKLKRVTIFPQTHGFNFGERSVPSLDHGTIKEQLPIENLTAYPQSGEQL